MQAARGSQVVATEIPSPRVTGSKNLTLSQASSDVASTNTETALKTPALAAKPIENPNSVTVRRDTNGRVYYSVTNTNSGQEILEIPPKALRDVSQGIEDYVKAVQSKAGAPVDLKA